MTDRPGWWRLMPTGTAPPLKAAVVVESFLVDGGRTVRLEHHLRRFRCSCEQMGLEVDERMLHSLVAEISTTLPVIGRWFPRLEARDGSPAPLVGWIREAPAARSSIRLWYSGRADPRLHPRAKGPDLPLLADLRLQARARYCDDAVLTTADGIVLETAHAGLLWWCGDELCLPGPMLPRLDSVTARMIIDLARQQGVRTRTECRTLAEIVGTEVWAVNTVHGIQAVTRWSGVAAVARPALDLARLRHFCEQLRIAARPISHHSTLGHRDANIVGRQL